MLVSRVRPRAVAEKLKSRGTVPLSVRNGADVAARPKVVTTDSDPPEIESVSLTMMVKVLKPYAVTKSVTVTVSV